MVDRLKEARRALGYADAFGLDGEPEQEPSKHDVLWAGDEIARAMEALTMLRASHSDEAEEREAALTSRASETAELRGAKDRDRGR